MSCGKLARGFATLLIGVSCHVTEARADVLTVGTDPACNFARPEAALAAATDGDEIRLAGAFLAVAAEIVDRDVTLRGGFASCAATAPTGISNLVGNGEPARSILTVRGAAVVRIEDVTFSDGDEGDDTDGDGPDDGAGGCIDFAATGSLSLLRTRIFRCRAAAGGGMWFEARNGPAALELEAVAIERNTARIIGGGLAIVGAVDATIAGSGVLADNQVEDGDGGGLYVVGAADVDIGATGLDGAFTPYLEANRASRQGAAVMAAPGARVRLYTADPLRPLTIARNGSGESVLRADSTSQDRGVICLWNVDVTANEGGSLGVAHGPRAGIHFNPDDAAGNLDCGARPAAARECPPLAPCNRIIDNDAAPPFGGMFRAELGAAFSLNRVTVGGNQPFAPLIVLASLEPAPLAVHNTAIARNAFEGGVVRVSGASNASLHQVTVVDNGIKGSCVVCIDDVFGASPTQLSVANAIIDQPQRSTIEDPRLFGLLQSTVRHAALTDVSTVPIDSVAVVRLSSPGDLPPLTLAGYVNREQGQYELAPESLLVDYAPAAGAPSLDALGRPRTRDLPLVPNAFGPRDLGAYETQNDAASLFQDGFE